MVHWIINAVRHGCVGVTLYKMWHSGREMPYIVYIRNPIRRGEAA